VLKTNSLALLGALLVLPALAPVTAQQAAPALPPSRPPALPPARPPARPPALPPALPPSVPPSVPVDQTHDFGVLPRGAVLPFHFSVPGVAERILKISKISITCDTCTTAVARQTEIPAGGAVEIDVLLDTATLSGEISKSIHVVTDDGRTTTMVLSAHVLPRVVATPPRFELDDLVQGEAAELTLTFAPGWRVAQSISVASDRPLAEAWAPFDELVPTRASLSPVADWLGVSAPRAVSDPTGAIAQELLLSIGESAPAASINARVTVQLDGEEPLHLPVVGRIVPALVMMPTTLAFGPVEEGQTGELVLELFEARGRPLRVTGLSCADPRLSARVEGLNSNTDPAPAARLVISFAGEPPLTLARTELVVLTDHPQQPRLVIPVFARVVSSSP